MTEIDPTRTTTNIRADSPTGSDDRVVVVGAHLDSVIAGPGINDNGSGTSTILEIAEEMAELGIRNRQKVRFAFWGAEELNLLGSQHHVNTRSDEEFQSIVANLNFDMVGSPSYVQACDTITNVDTKALFELGDAAAHATMTLARTRAGFFEDGSFRTRARVATSARALPYSGPQAVR